MSGNTTMEFIMQPSVIHCSLPGSVLEAGVRTKGLPRSRMYTVVTCVFQRMFDPKAKSFRLNVLNQRKTGFVRKLND